MVDLRICVGDVKKGRTYQKVLNENEASFFKGLKVGDKIKGEGFGMGGYELEITGGSDHCGFPMRKGIDSVGRVKIYAQGGVGIKKSKGKWRRKSVAGSIMGGKTTQVNLKVLTYGKKSVAECFGVEEKAKKEESKKEIKEEKVEEKKVEEKKEEVKKEEPKEIKRELKEKIKGEKKPSAQEVIKEVSEQIKEEKIKEEKKKKEEEAKKVPSAAELAEKKKEEVRGGIKND